jgi:hypothetical protein
MVTIPPTTTDNMVATPDCIEHTPSQVQRHRHNQRLSFIQQNGVYRNALAIDFGRKKP